MIFLTDHDCGFVYRDCDHDLFYPDPLIAIDLYDLDFVYALGFWIDFFSILFETSFRVIEICFDYDPF